MSTSSSASIISALLLALGGLSACAGAPYPLVDEAWQEAGARDARLLWTVDLGRGGTVSPAPLDDGALFAAAGHEVARLDAASGAIRWKRKLPGKVIALAATADAGFAACEGSGRELVALDLDTGEVRWRVKGAGRLVAAAGATVLGMDGDGRLLGFEPATGTVAWRAAATGHPFGGAAVLPADSLVVFAAGSDSLVGVRAGTGEIAWRERVGHRPRGIDGGAFGLLVVVEAGRLLRMDPADGRVLASVALAGIPAGVPAAVGDCVAVATTGGVLEGYTLPDLARRWSRTLDAPLVTGPVAAGGLFVQAGPRGEMLGVDPADGTTGAAFRHPEKLVSAPAVAQGTILAIGGAGTVAAYRGEVP